MVGAFEADRGALLYVVCGPPPMIDSVERSLAALGVPGNRGLTEKFAYDCVRPPSRDGLQLVLRTLCATWLNNASMRFEGCRWFLL